MFNLHEDVTPIRSCSSCNRKQTHSGPFSYLQYLDLPGSESLCERCIFIFFLPCKPMCGYVLSKCTVQHSAFFFCLLSIIFLDSSCPVHKGKSVWRRFYQVTKSRRVVSKCDRDCGDDVVLDPNRDLARLTNLRRALEMDCGAAFCITDCTV